ncbi:6-bladed beta-propeller [candidate division KSB1 bacterium]
MRFFINLLLTFLTFTLFGISCKVSYEDRNSNPVNTGDGLVKISKHVSINPFGDEYKIKDVTWIDAYTDGNIYILDHFDSNIVIFNSKGEYIKTYGGKGQGPRDLETPNYFAFQDEKIYVNEQSKGIKIWDLNSAYMGYRLFKSSGGISDPIWIRGNAAILPWKDSFVGCTEVYNFEKQSLRRIEIVKYDQQLKFENIIVSVEFDVIKDIKFLFGKMIPIDSKGNIYFPESRNEYKINKFNMKGELLDSFGRKYERERTTSATLSAFGKRNPPSRKAAMKYPPVVRLIFVDENNLIWVIVGEYCSDNYETKKINSTVDIFNTDGTWLYTFRTDVFGTRSVMKHGLLYTRPVPVESPIIVYKIDHDLK